MASVTVLYTNTDAIRSAIGVDDADVSNAMITSQDMTLQMNVALTKFLPTHVVDFAASATVENQLRLWCMWYGAWRLAESPPAVPKRLSTGKDEYERFPINWKELAKNARAHLDELEEALVPTTGGSGLTIMGKATPDSDPITNT
jgi:hypothetical protein